MRTYVVTNDPAWEGDVLIRLTPGNFILGFAPDGELRLCAAFAAPGFERVLSPGRDCFVAKVAELDHMRQRNED